MTTAAATLSVDISANLAKLYDGLTQATKAVNNSATAMTEAFRGVGKSLLELAAGVASVGAVMEGIKSALNFGDELQTMSERLGIGVEKLQELSAIAVQSNTSLEGFSKAIKFLSTSLVQAQDAGSVPQRLFKALGVEAKDAAGNIRSTSEVLPELAEALNNIGNETLRTAAGVKIFGRGYLEIAASLATYKESQEEARKVMEQFGTVTATATKAADALHDRFKLLDEGFKASALTGLAPGFAALNSALISLTPLIATLSKAFGDFFGWLGGVAAETLVRFAGVFKILGETIAAVFAAIATRSTAPLLELQGNINKIKADTLAAIGELRAAAKFPGLDNSDQVSRAAAASDRFANRSQVNAKAVADALGKQDKSLHDSSGALDAYAKALAASEKTLAEAAASIVAAGIKEQENDLERSYQRGLLQFNEYYSQKIALQRAAQANQEALLQQDIKVQGDLVSSLVDNFNSLYNDKSRFDSQDKQDEYDKRLLKVLGDLDVAYANYVKAQAALNVAQLKGTEIGKGYLEELIKANQGVLVGVKALETSIAAAERENEAIGLTKDQVILLNVARIQNIRNMQAQAGASQDVLDALDAEIEKTRELATVAAQGIAKQQWVQGWSDLFRSAADEGAKFIEDFAQHGSSAFKNLWNDFKTWALEAIAKIAAQQIVLSIVGSINPGLGGIAGNALQGSGGPIGSILSSLGGGGPGGLLSGLQSVFTNGFGGISNSISNGFTTAIGSIFGGSTAGLAAAPGALEAGGLAAGLESGLTAAGTAAETAALSLSTLVPVIGTIAIAGYALYTFLQSKKGGPKVGGEGGANTLAGASLGFFPGETTAEGNKTAEQLATAAFTTYSDTLLKLGGKNAAGTGFYFGFDTDPKGTAASRALSEVQIAGNTIFKNINASIGRSPEELQAALQTEANRAVLGALQNSDLPKAVTNVLNSVVAATASDTDISAVEALAEGVKSVLDTLKNTMPTKFAAINAAIENINFTGIANKMQAVFSAAFGAIDPALQGLIDNFKGTDTEVAAFGSTLLTIYDTTNKIAALKFPTADEATGFITKIADTIKSGYVPGAGLSSTIGHITAQGETTTPAGTSTTSSAVEAAVADYQKAVLAVLDGTQETADKVLVFVQTILAFGDAINGVGADLHNLDPKYITAFIDALGGAQAAAAAFTYLQANFTTAADKTAKANADLTKSFADLGLTLPSSHQAFLDLLNSFDLTTDAGRALYASVIALAPAFVAIAGTADQAAKAIQDAAGFFAQNFYSETEKNTAKITAEIAQLDAVQAALGVTIPHTVDGFRALIESLDRTAPAGEALYEALIVLAPAILDVSKGVAGLASSATSAATAIAAAAETIFGSVSGDASDAAAAYVEKVKALADQIPNAGFGDKLTFEIDLINKQIKDALKKADDPSLDQATRNAYALLAARLGYTNNQMINELARFTVLSAQYSAATAEQLVNLEDWYDQQKKLFNGDAETLAALDIVFKQKWDAIIKGISDGVGGSIDELAKLRKSIADYLKGLFISELSPLTPAQKLAEAQKQYQEELAKAAKGDPTALADITKFADEYLKAARDFYASGSQYTDIFKAITDALAKLAGDAYDGAGNGHGGFDFKGGTGAGGGTTSASALNDALFHSLPGQGQQLASAADIAAATKALSKVINDAIGALAESNTQDAHHVSSQVNRLGPAIIDGMGRNLK